MNQRDALRFAASELLEIAQSEAEGYAQGARSVPQEWTNRDVQRIVRGFQTLAARLEYTVTGERTARVEPGDPDQIPLFEESR